MPEELLLNLDMPDHTRMRSVVTNDYSANGVEALRPTVDAVITERFTALRRETAPDLFRAVLDLIPVTVNCHFLGLPRSDIAYFRPSSRIVQMAPWENVPELLDNFWKFYDYVVGLVTGNRSTDPNGLIARFVANRTECDPPLTDKELVGILLGSLLGADRTSSPCSPKSSTHCWQHPNSGTAWYMTARSSRN